MEKIKFLPEWKGFTIQAGSYKDKETALAKKKKSFQIKKDWKCKNRELEKTTQLITELESVTFRFIGRKKNYSEKF